MRSSSAAEKPATVSPSSPLASLRGAGEHARYGGDDSEVVLTYEGLGCHTLRAGRYLLRLDRIRRHSSDLNGELSAAVLSSKTSPKLFARFSINLLAAQTRERQATYLQRKTSETELPWLDWIDRLILAAIEQDRLGEPAIDLVDVPASVTAHDEALIVHGLTLSRHHISTVFGAQDSAKSWNGLATGVQLAQWEIATAYLDWELDASTHRARAAMIVESAIPRGLHYLKMGRPLIADLDRVQDLLREQKIQYLIVDSLALAAGGDLDSAEIANATMGALREFGIGVLCIAHITKAAAEGQAGDPSGPIGSVFFGNNSRASWFVKRSSDDDGTGSLRVGAFCKKWSFGPRPEPVGIDFRFGDGRVFITNYDIAESSDLSSTLPVWRRMSDELARGPMRPIELAEVLGVKVDTVTRTARANRNRFLVVAGAAGVQGTIRLTGSRS